MDCVILLTLCFTKSSGLLLEGRVTNIFPEDYDKYEPPWNKERPAHVYLQLSIMDVDKIDDGAMEYSLQSYLGEFWKDHRLNLSYFQAESAVNPIFPTYLTKNIWVPDLVFDNTRNGMLFQLSLPNTNIKVLKDGTFLRSSRYNLLVGCQMDFRLYPMDTQKCFMKISTMSNPDFKVLLHWVEEYPQKMQSILFMSDIQPLKYTLHKPESYKSTEVWTSGNYTYLYANFTFTRRLSGSLFNVYVPSTLVVFLSWISFWVDIEAVPARVTLGVTSLLTLATQMVQAHVGLPPISYMTAIDVWLFACLITVFSALIEFAFSYQIFYLKQQRTVEVEPNMKVTKVKQKFDTTETTILRSGLSQDLTFRGSKVSTNNSAASEKLETVKKIRKSLDAVSRKLFPFLFLVFAVIYWTFYLYIK